MDSSNSPNTAQEKANQTTLLDQIKADLQDQMKTAAGLGNLEEILMRKPSDYKTLTASEFKHLKEQLTLHSFLPKAPTLAEFQFSLQKKGGALLKEQFEDVWSSATLNYAAAAESFAAALQLLDDEKVEEGNEIFRAASTALLAASNVLARTLQTYKDIATRQASEGSQRAGAGRESISSTEEAKSMHVAVDAASKLQKLTQPRQQQPFFKRFQRPRRNKFNHWRNRAQRGRGFARRGGRSNHRATNTDSKE